MKKVNLKKMMVFAHSIYRLSKDMEWPQALREAWAYFKANQEPEMIVMTKVSGEESKRLVDFNWQDHYTPTGGGHPLKEGQTLMVDMCKKYVGANRFLISTYKYRKVS